MVKGGRLSKTLYLKITNRKLKGTNPSRTSNWIEAEPISWLLAWVFQKSLIYSLYCLCLIVCLSPWKRYVSAQSATNLLQCFVWMFNPRVILLSIMCVMCEIGLIINVIWFQQSNPAFTLPWWILIVLSALSPISGLLITRTMVFPSFCSHINNSMTFSSISSSRFPVISSARIIAGSLMRARAIHTLCWPATQLADQQRQCRAFGDSATDDSQKPYAT